MIGRDQWERSDSNTIHHESYQWSDQAILLFGRTLQCDSEWIDAPLAPTDLYLQPQGLG